MTAKERLRSLAEELSEAEAARAVSLVEEQLDDPMLLALSQAPDDDEPTTPEENVGAREAMDEYRGGEALPPDRVGDDLG